MIRTGTLLPGREVGLSRHRFGRAAGGDGFTGAPTFNSIAVLAFVGIVASVVMIYSVGPGERRSAPPPRPARIPAMVGDLPTPTPVPSMSDVVLEPSAPAPSPSSTPVKATTAAPPAAPVLPAPTTTSLRPAPLQVTAHYVTRTDWGDGFVADIFVQNVSGEPQTWAVDLRYTADVRITDGPWNASVERSDTTFRFRSTWVLKPGESVQFGFVAAKSRSSTSTPSLCAVNARACT